MADDLTGSCDLADAVVSAGMSTVVAVGVPDGELPPAGCWVIGLRSRTVAASVAVAGSRQAGAALLAAGAALLYEKYCSTFDSTADGNIGPIGDALLEVIGAALTVGTPATPRSGRTVYQGHLFVGRQLLSESPMRDHPLTPMRDADLVAMLGRQTRHPVEAVVRPPGGYRSDRLARALLAATRRGARHVILDALADDDLDCAAAAIDQLSVGGTRVVVAGAAGLAAALARRQGQHRPVEPARARPAERGGRRLILAGSCSRRTREQVAAFHGPAFQLSPVELAADPGRTAGGVLDAVRASYAVSEKPVLVFSSAAPAEVAAVAARVGPGRAARLVEVALGEIARRAVAELGVRRVLVAGGETSGAVLSALGVTVLRVGMAVEPGLPWMVPAGDGPAILLKSGNFGTPTLFDTAWDTCP